MSEAPNPRAPRIAIKPAVARRAKKGFKTQGIVNASPKARHFLSGYLQKTAGEKPEDRVEKT